METQTGSNRKLSSDRRVFNIISVVLLSLLYPVLYSPVLAYPLRLLHQPGFDPDGWIPPASENIFPGSISVSVQSAGRYAACLWGHDFCDCRWYILQHDSYEHGCLCAFKQRFYIP